jgi:hypothetical protein
MDFNLESPSLFNILKIKIMENKIEYLSLYDYLGKPAGKELGGEVAQAAYQGGIKPQERQISNPKYTGTVHLYPKDFLDFYFEKPEENLTLGDIQDYDLSF